MPRTALRTPRALQDLLGRARARLPERVRGRPGSVLVSGPSMLPAVRDGDCLLVLWGGGVRPGDLVVARPWVRPELLVVKRAVAQVPGGWEVVSDNPLVAGLGWSGGEVDVLGRVLLRWWPLRPPAHPG